MGFEDRQYYRDPDQPLYSSYSPTSTQSVVNKLIIANVIVLVLDIFSSPVGDKGTQWISYALSLRMDSLWQFWTLLSYGFTHASYKTEIGLFHIIGNMIILYVLGRPIEERVGGAEFLKFYLVSIVIAGLGWILAMWAYGAPNASMVGASGGVSAVIVYFILMAPFSQLMLWGIVPIPAWGLGVLFLIFNFFSAINPKSMSAWEAHLFGAIFGAAYWKFRWSFSRFSMPGFVTRFFSGGPRLRVHDPGAIDDKLQAKAEELLEKISQHGEDSLTGRERRLLKKYSEQVRRNRDR